MEQFSIPCVRGESFQVEKVPPPGTLDKILEQLRKQTPWPKEVQ